MSALETQLKKVESSANDVVSSAKSDFPNETSAMSSSLKALDTARLAGGLVPVGGHDRGPRRGRQERGDRG